MRSEYCWSGRVFGSLLSVALAANIVHAQQQESAAETGEAGPAGAPAVVDGHSFAGQVGAGLSGAIGRFSYIQFAKDDFGGSARIYNRHSHAVIATGKLNELAGTATPADDAHVIWDATTNRFYYAMSTQSSSQKISFGFSKTPNPTTISSADWCHYHLLMTHLSENVSSPKLGDNKDFFIIGYRYFKPIRPNSRIETANVVAFAKPPAGTTCPNDATLKSKSGGAVLHDPSGADVWAPVPANQVDDGDVGYVVARNLSLPSDKLWFFKVHKGADGLPRFGPARALKVPSYTFPPDATQPSDDRRLDTGDARPSPAVQAINPVRETNSFWFTQTVKHPSQERSVVRWYEVDPAPPAPVLLRSGVIGNNGSETFFFNAAISPDRRKDGVIAQFGESFVIQFNVSSSTVNPGIRAASSFKGGGLKFLSVRRGAVPDLHHCSDDPSVVCPWAAYSSVAPDPRPTSVGRGAVWGTNQYAGEAQTRESWIFALQP